MAEQNPDFRQQAIATANLLFEAAAILQNQPGDESPSTSRGSSRAIPSHSQPLRDRLSLQTHRRSTPSASGSCPRVRAELHVRSSSANHNRSSADSELSSLFNWSTSAGKRGKRQCGKRLPPKKKKITWTHTWVCLSGKRDDKVPDSTDRVTLKLAGLGEKRFALDRNATAQDVYDALEYQYPKLRGFELLRACEGGSKELAVLQMPIGGYTTEYLKAVMNNAKLYIRPLQTDLSESVEPGSSGFDVSFTVYMFSFYER